MTWRDREQTLRRAVDCDPTPQVGSDRRQPIRALAQQESEVPVMTCRDDTHKIVKRLTRQGQVGKVIAAAIARGWTIQPTKSGHYQMKHPAGGLVHVSSTPSDTHAWKSIRGDLVRAEKLSGVAA